MAEPVIVLAETRTRDELHAVTEWVAATHPGAPIWSPSGLAVDRLDAETLLVPVRPVWLPAVHQGERRVTVGDVLVLSNPRRPAAIAQPIIRRRRPDALRVARGEPATVADLRARYERDTAEGESFSKFVAMQAALSTERAERQIIGDRYKVPRLVAEQISMSARFRENAAKLAAELGRPTDSVVREATEKLTDFVATQSRLMGDVFSAIFNNLHERAWTVSVDEDTLAPLRTLNKSSGLIFLPSHRSYVDPLVLAEALRDNDFPPNLVLGGNNLSFWPVGPIARRAGMIFIRRKFGGDPVYKFAMRSYLAHIVEKRFNLEWYIEGGRSRTGKLRKPMLGLLAYVVDAIEQLDDADMMVVPTSIVYDQLHEIGAMAAEDAGGAKKPEGLTWLFNYARGQRNYLGEARVRFGEPFSLRSAIAEVADDPAKMEKIAFRVMDEINTATPISATSLAGFAMLGARNKAYTGAEIEAIIAPLLRYIERRDLPGPNPALCRGIGLRQTLGVLTDGGVLGKFDGGPETVWSIAPGSHPVAAYYRNGALHHFVDRAIIEVAMIAAADGDLDAQGADLLAACQQEALRLRDLLKFEFFFPVKDVYLSQLAAELDLLAPKWRSHTPSPAWTDEVLHSHAGELFARRTLQPFFDAQLVMANRLVRLLDSARKKDDILADCLGLGRQLSLQGVVRSPDSVSKDLYDGAYRLAENRGLVGGDQPDRDRAALTTARQAWLDEVEGVRARLARIAEIEVAQAESLR